MSTVIADYIVRENARNPNNEPVHLVVEQSTDGKGWHAFIAAPGGDGEPIADYETDQAVIGYGEAMSEAIEDLANSIANGFESEDE